MHCALLLLAILQGTTVNVTGTIVEARTGTPLGRVLVLVEGTPISTQTAADGSFTLAVPAGPQRLFVSLVGYALVRRDLVVQAGISPLTIPLAEGTGTYTESVTVAADRFLPAEPAVPTQHLLGSAELQNLRGVLADDPLRAVQTLPGVVAGDDLRSEFSVRGSPFSQINMTVDGFSTPYILHTVRAIEDFSSSGSVAMINSDILQDVALLSGSYPQRFGNRTGAEVDFRLREGSRERRQTRLAVSGTNASAVLEGPIGASSRGSWLISARQSYLDLIVRQVAEGVQFGFTDAQARLAYDLDSTQRVDLTVITGRSSLEERDPDLEIDDRFIARNASVIAIPSWRRTTPRSSLSVRAMTALNFFSNTTPEGIRIDEGEDLQVAWRADASLAATSKVLLEGAADADWTRQDRARQRSIGGRYRVINDFEAEATRGGGYLQARVTAGRFTLVPGIRGDTWTLTGQATASPWMQAAIELPGRLAVRTGGGIYRQFPAFEQVVGAFAATSTRPLRARHLDVSLEGRIGTASRWQVSVYDREESDFYRRPASESRLVDGRFVAGSRTAPFVQGLSGTARGVELLVQRKSASGLSGWVSYAFGRSRYDDSSTEESFFGDQDQRHTVNLYGFLRASDRVSFSAKARVGTNVPAPGYYRAEEDRVLLAETRNGLRLPAYARVDLRANRTFNWSRSRLTLFGEVINVLNRDNVRFNPPSVNRFSLEARNIFEQMVPILPSVGVLIEF
jgi:hypothetical protein